MIYRINRSVSDKKFIKNRGLVSEKRNLPPQPFDYNNVIVKKPWGYEYLVFENGFVALWLLQIIRKRRTSMHCHAQKKTGLVLLSGTATHYNLKRKIELHTLDAVNIEEGVFHSTEASSKLPVIPHSENGIWVMEIESPSLKTDLVRIKDEYGRTAASYEGLDNMVFEPKACLKFQMPPAGGIVSSAFQDLVFTIKRGGFNKNKDELFSKPNTLVSIIGYEGGIKPDNPYLKVGEVVTFREFYKNTKEEDLGRYHILSIEKKANLVKLSDYVFSFIQELGTKHVFAVCGGAAMHLVDSLGKNSHLRYVATHHEQAAAMAAEGYSRISDKPGVVMVTSGPGGTNTITGLCGAWVDSIPLIFISGQVTTDTLIGNTGLRQFGIQESDIVNLVKPVTKYAVTIKNPASVKYHLQKALYLATGGRPGPVWLDIPLDIQSKLVDINELVSFDPKEIKQKKKPSLLSTEIDKCINMLKKAKRPVLIAGYGIRLSNGQDEFRRLVERLRIPVITSWTASDLLDADHRLYIGRSGIFGDRAGNFTVQNADLLLIIGSRMSIPQVGYNYHAFAREAKKIMVDIDIKELKKPSLKIDLPLVTDAKEFMSELLKRVERLGLSKTVNGWVKICRKWKIKYPVVLPEYRDRKDAVNSFYFIDVLSQKLDKSAVIVTDMGTSFTCTMQTFKVKQGQRLFTSAGHSSMGFGLPGAIGACFANNRKKVICITGDGGLQMNIQELQTVAHHHLPIIIFVLNNGGYLTIKLMQQNHFGRYVGSNKESGLTCPDIVKIAGAYGIKAERINNHDELHAKIGLVLAQPGPFICEIIMPQDQPLIPRVSSLKKPDGTILSKPLEDMYPFLSREEFLRNMIVKPIEILK